MFKSQQGLDVDKNNVNCQFKTNYVSSNAFFLYITLNMIEMTGIAVRFFGRSCYLSVFAKMGIKVFS